MICIYTVCKDRAYPGSAGQGLTLHGIVVTTGFSFSHRVECVAVGATGILGSLQGMGGLEYSYRPAGTCRWWTGF